MNPRCRQAVEAAAGRRMTEGEIKAIEDRISRTMREMARTDPTWRGKSSSQRMIEAAQRAAQDVVAEAQLKVQRAQMQLIATAGMGNRIGDLMANYAVGRSHALVKEMELTHNYAEGIKRETMSQLMPLLDAVGSRKGVGLGRGALMFLFDAENPKMTQDLSREIFNGADGSTGNQMAQKAAKVWLDQIEGMRTRFNSAGGDVGKLDYGYLPQPHDQALVRGAGDTAARDKWVADSLPLMDRSRYMQEDGAQMTDTQLAAVLNTAWDTISTGGISQMVPGQNGGSGAKANAGSESRVIHFKDADAYLTYMNKYGGGTMYDAMIGHIGGMSRNIALVERYGPNPETQMRLQFDLASKAETRDVADLPRTFGQQPQTYWDLVSGKTGQAPNGNLARIAQDIRNVNVFGKLACATISSLTDFPNMMIMTGYNKLSYFEMLKNIGKQFDGDTRDFLTMHGVIAESMVSNLNRWAGDNIKNNWSGRIANSTMKLSLMNVWTDSMRRAFSMTMMGGLAKLSKTDWAALSEWDRAQMMRKGITAEDWGVIKKAQLTVHDGVEFLTPEAIRAGGHERSNEVVAKFLGLITDESEYAVLNPDLATKGIASAGGIQRGTVLGELARTAMQFKSFPTAMISRHFRRMLESPSHLEGAPMLANKAVYGMSMALTMTAAGAIVFQIKNILQGKDPIDMTKAKFWVRAAAQGGALSIVGDLLLADPVDNPGDPVGLAAKTLAGPTFGTIGDLALRVGQANIAKKMHGKETHAAAETLQVARSMTPYINLWYAKAAVDHMGMHALQESLSPGYLSRMQQRANKQWDQGYYWKPGTGLPDRAPDLSAVKGK